MDITWSVMGKQPAQAKQIYSRYFVEQTVSENKEIHQANIVLVPDRNLRTKIKKVLLQSLCGISSHDRVIVNNVVLLLL